MGVDMMESYIQKSPMEPLMHFYKGLLTNGDTATRQSGYETALMLDPSNLTYCVQMLIFHLENENHDQLSETVGTCRKNWEKSLVESPNLKHDRYSLYLSLLASPLVKSREHSDLRNELLMEALSYDPSNLRAEYILIITMTNIPVMIEKLTKFTRKHRHKAAESTLFHLLKTDL
eukprot:GHVL01024059.1.p1 GENE.GHVL01024059.1~~GHVL01024059.1.p1  ORF type:complete len:175 (+),score=29.45 GHVL01024059.1:789-1313(+)